MNEEVDQEQERETAPSLLEQKRALELATRDRIGALLVTREQGQIAWDQQLVDIAAELKELGYKRPRAAKIVDPNAPVKVAAKKKKSTKKPVDKSVVA